MQQFNPAGKSKAVACAEARGIENRKARRKYEMANGADFMQSEHLYEMHVGGESTGELKRMLGREAKLENGLAMLRFGSGKDTKLHVWRWQKRQEEAAKSAAEAIIKARR